MMILDKLFGNDDNNENGDITEGNGVSKNEEFEAHKRVQQTESNGKEANDPSAQRNTGANGYTQRSDQKDQLENLHIGGDETTPQGGNDHKNAGEQAQGPGFEAEGTYELDHTVRTSEQKFGEDAPSGPDKPLKDGTISQ
jgi:hypothetical protein